MAPRTSIPGTVEAEVATKAARRCCLCYGLRGDLGEKKGQIAHLDQDPANAAPDNLAWLCFDHHDEYDSTTRQSKGLLLEEVKRYRTALWRAVERRDHYRASSPNTAPNPKAQRINEWAGRLISVHRYQTVDASPPGFPVFNNRDFKVVDCDDFLVRFQDLCSQRTYSVALEDVKIRHDEEKYRPLLELREGTRL